jgi:hypothetical protein
MAASTGAQTVTEFSDGSEPHVLSLVINVL